MTDSDGAANANNLAGTDGSFVVAKHAFRTDDVSFVNGSNMAELGAIKEGTGGNTRTDHGSVAVAYARHALKNGSNMVEFRVIKEGTGGNTRIDDGSWIVASRHPENGSNMAELRAIKEANGNHLAGTGAIMRTDDGSLVVASYAKHAFKNGSNTVELRAIKEGSYSGCIVEELPTMRLDVVPGENEKRSRKITLDLSQKAEIKRLENMATSIQKRFEILEIKRAQGSVKSLPSDNVQDNVSQVQGSMESLPSDVVQDIVSRVPAESVLECKLVCKKWGTLVRETNFANMHLSCQLNHLHGGDVGNDNIAAKVEPGLFFACRIDDPDVFKTLLFHGGQLSDRIRNDEEYIYNQNLKRIYHAPMHNKPSFSHLVGSCNGLVCTLQDHHLVLDPIYICNPLTREYVYLPELVVKKEDVDPDRFRIEGGEVNMYNYIACGFGYVRSTNEYKIVRIHYLQYDGGIVEVYTLGSGCGWRAVGTVSYRLDTTTKGMGTCANDALYWITYKEVVAFDLAKEEFRLLSVPPCLQNRQRGDRCGLVVLGGHLCLYMDKVRMEIWSLVNSTDSKESWCMEFDIDYEAVVAGSRKRNFRPILSRKNGEIVFLYADSVLYCYDTKTATLKMMSNEASTGYIECVEAIAHVNTFASLEAIGENSKTYTVRPRWVRTPWDDVIDELDQASLGEKIDTTRFRLR